MDYQSISFQKDLAVYRLLGAVRAQVGFTWLSAEDRLAAIEESLAECEAERAALDAAREAAQAAAAAAAALADPANDVRGMYA